jgi:SAM-dependent methyltransferase
MLAKRSFARLVQRLKQTHEDRVTEPIYHERPFAGLYDAANPWSQDRTFCLAFAKGRQSVLDLGCGTGSLASAIARTHGCDVTGVDPAQAMLDQVVHHEGHDRVQWICADAREVCLGRRFDLVVMTGHAFQCFLTSADRVALFKTIAAHLSLDGEFIFDSRNPLKQEWLEWTPEKTRHTFRHPSLGDVEAWDDCSFDPATQVVTYEWFYRVATGEVMHAPASRIVFPSREVIAAELAAVGLRVTRWLGDWDGRPIGGEELEIIPIGRLAVP